MVAALKAGQLPQEQVAALEELVGSDRPLRESLMETLIQVLVVGGRGGEALLVLDELAGDRPEEAGVWWVRRYDVLRVLAGAGRWAVVEAYLKEAGERPEGVAEGQRTGLAALAQQATRALDRMTAADLVARWLTAEQGPAETLAERLRGRGAEVLAALVDGLEVPEPEARGRAVEFLRELSSQNFAFDPEGEEEARAQAVARWRAWLTESQEPEEAEGTEDAGQEKPSGPGPEGKANGDTGTGEE